MSAHPLDAFVGVPFVVGGRSFAGCDCWGVVALYRSTLGLPVPQAADYVTAEGDDAVAALDGLLARFRKLAADEPSAIGDMVVVRQSTPHVGVIVSLAPLLMLTSSIEHDSVIERIDAPKWAHRIEGIYRA